MLNMNGLGLHESRCLRLPWKNEAPIQFPLRFLLLAIQALITETEFGNSFTTRSKITEMQNRTRTNNESVGSKQQLIAWWPLGSDAMRINAMAK